MNNASIRNVFFLDFPPERHHPRPFWNCPQILDLITRHDARNLTHPRALSMSLTWNGSGHGNITPSHAGENDPLRSWLDLNLLPQAVSMTHHCLPLSLPLANRVALSRALACPDLFVIDAAAAERESLLEALLAAEPAGPQLILTSDVDLANRLVEQGGVRAIRALAPGETLDSLPPSIRDRSTPALQQAQMSLRETLARIRSLQATRQECLLSQGEASPAPADSHRPSALSALDAELDALTGRLTDLENARTQCHSGQPSGLIHRLFHRKKLADHGASLAEIEEQIRTYRAEVMQVQARRESMLKEMSSHTSARQAQGRDDKLTWLDHEVQTLTESARGLSEILTPLGMNPEDPTSLWNAAEIPDLDSLHRENDARESPRQPSPVEMRKTARGLLSHSAAVIGPLESVGCDDLVIGARFERLWIDSAEPLDEAWFLAAMPLAPRRVILGQIRAAQGWNDFPSLGSQGLRFSKGDPVVMEVLARLASRLDQETWSMDGDRLVCRLLPAGEDAVLSREPLLDRPEIELLFATHDDSTPALAEVVFPAGTTAAEAKTFLFTHLGAVLLRPVGESHTHEHAEAVLVCWPAVDRGEERSEWVLLEPGIREKVQGEGAQAYTAAVAFDRAHGWNAERAAAWLADHLPTDSPSRVATLTRQTELAVA